MCYTYDKLLSRTGISEVIFGYNGRDGVVTDDNGLIYMRARYYSPDMKRFINADIVAGDISNAVTLNRFAYANGNPVSFVDPFGLSVERGGISDAQYEEFISIMAQLLTASKRFGITEMKQGITLGNITYYSAVDITGAEGPIDLSQIQEEQIGIMHSLDFENGTFTVTQNDTSRGIYYSIQVDDFHSVYASVTTDNKNNSINAEYGVQTQIEKDSSIFVSTLLGAEIKKDVDTNSSSAQSASVPEDVSLWDVARTLCNLKINETFDNIEAFMNQVSETGRMIGESFQSFFEDIKSIPALLPLPIPMIPIIP